MTLIAGGDAAGGDLDGGGTADSSMTAGELVVVATAAGDAFGEARLVARRKATRRGDGMAGVRTARGAGGEMASWGSGSEAGGLLGVSSSSSSSSRLKSAPLSVAVKLRRVRTIGEACSRVRGVRGAISSTDPGRGMWVARVRRRVAEEGSDESDNSASLPEASSLWTQRAV